MAVISINYGDHKKPNQTYKHVSISSSRSAKKKVYRSGYFVKDWYMAKRYYMLILDKAGNEPMFSQSSSVDHFIMDGAKFTSAYLHMEEELYVDENGVAQKRHNPVLKYFDDEPDEIKKWKLIDGWEYFVPLNARWTWAELKSYVKKGITPKKAKKVKQLANV